MKLYNFTTYKYKKSINFSKECISFIVDEVENLLNIKHIKFEEYDRYSPNNKLNCMYLIYDVMDLNSTKNSATWSLLKIIMRGNPVIVLNAFSNVNYIKEGKAALGPLYIDGKLIYNYPTTNIIYTQILSYITKNILSELE